MQPVPVGIPDGSLAPAAVWGAGKGPYSQAGGTAVCLIGAGAGAGRDVWGGGDFTATLTNTLKCVHQHFLLGKIGCLIKDNFLWKVSL